MLSTRGGADERRRLLGGAVSHEGDSINYSEMAQRVGERAYWALTYFPIANYFSTGVSLHHQPLQAVDMAGGAIVGDVVMSVIREMAYSDRATPLTCGRVFRGLVSSAAGICVGGVGVGYAVKAIGSDNAFLMSAFESYSTMLAYYAAHLAMSRVVEEPLPVGLSEDALKWRQTIGTTVLRLSEPIALYQALRLFLQGINETEILHYADFQILLVGFYGLVKLSNHFIHDPQPLAWMRPEPREESQGADRTLTTAQPVVEEDDEMELPSRCHVSWRAIGVTLATGYSKFAMLGMIAYGITQGLAAAEGPDPEQRSDMVREANLTTLAVVTIVADHLFDVGIVAARALNQRATQCWSGLFQPRATPPVSGDMENQVQPQRSPS